jgi:hypothetical protein
MSSVIQAILKELHADALIKQTFENLKDGEFKKTSSCDPRYNCIAHAAWDCRRKWWPMPQEYVNNDRHWPKEAPPEETEEAFIIAFGLDGYEPCDSAELEEGYEKVALYVSDKATLTSPKGTPTHMARQLPCGKWTTKAGDEWDFIHDTPEGVQGKTYGVLKGIMRRQRLFRIVKVNNEDSEKTEAAKASNE